MRPRHKHGLGPDFEALVRDQLDLGERWRISGSGIEEVERKSKREGIEFVAKETVAYCELEASEALKDAAVDAGRCPACGGGLRRRGNRDERSWRHLSVLGKPFEIRATLMRLQCLDDKCGRYCSLQAPWESPSKHFTLAQEEVVLKQVMESGFSGAALLLAIAASSLHKLVERRVDSAHAAQDWSGVTAIGVDDYAIGEGHEYVSIFSDIITRRVLFVAAGRSHETFKLFLEEGRKHRFRPDNVVYVSMDMGTGYIKGAMLNFPRAVIVFDKFHVIKLANDKVDQVRRSELGKATASIRGHLKGNRWLYLKNVVNLTEKEKVRFSRIDMTSFWAGRAYQIRVALQGVYAYPDKGRARSRLKALIRWIRRLCKDAPAYFSVPMRTLASTLEERADGILSHWDSKLTNAFHEGMHSAYSAVKRKARGLSFDGMRTLLYLHYGKLDFGFDLNAPLQTSLKQAPSLRLTPSSTTKSAAREIA
jgi:transposase